MNSLHDIASSVSRFNAGRDPERLAMKLARMRANPFVFLRGTCHRFYERLPKDGLFATAPAAWICGDAHLENFGTYKGDNRLAYFDVNDFDEAALAPVTWDLVRFLASVLLAGDTVRATASESLVLCTDFIDAYAAALGSGKACWVERDTARGLVRTLLDEIRERRRADFLDRRTVCKARRRAILCDGKHALEVTVSQRAHVTQLVDRFAKTQADPSFFEVLDVARRIAGTGSLGVDRFIVLVRGKGSPDGNYLLDLKQAMPSEPARWAAPVQPAWATEAERVVSIQQRMQAVAMAFLHPIAWNGSSYILRALQPTEDRIALGVAGVSHGDVKSALRDMGHVLASAHLRSGGRQGSAIADELMDFAAARGQWRDALVEAAQACADDVVSEWKHYAKAFDGGAFPAAQIST
jgi:uncharacterized protein (DUF2252 family)